MLIFDYFLWHYLQAPKKILAIWGNFLQFFLFYFIPVPQLLKTFFSPWKRDVTRYGKGFDFKRFFETLAFNLISRFLGAAVRLIAIFFSLFLTLLVFLVGLLLVIFWLFWPFFLAGSLVNILFSLSQAEGQKISALSILIFHLATIFFFGLAWQKSKEKSPEQMSLSEVFQQDWSEIIWEKLGLKRTDVPPEIIEEPDKYLDEYLKQKEIEKEDFSYVLEWQTLEKSYQQKRKKFWEKEILFTKGGLGRSWIYGWTNTLDRYSLELGDLRKSTHLIGRRGEVEAMGRILCKSQQGNVLLVGQPGVGKTTLVRQFARLVKQGRTASLLAWRRVLELDLNAALAGLMAENQVKERLIRLFNEATAAGNIILVINDFHNFVNPQEKDISSVLIPFIEGAYFQLIALTTYDELHNVIEKNPSLLKFFEKVEIKEPDDAHVLLILQDNLTDIEKRTNKCITYQALKEIVKTAQRYISDVPMPEKAIDLMEETTIYVVTNTPEYFVMPKHVDLVVSQKTEIPVGEIQGIEKEKLLNLEEFLHQRIIGQDLAIKEVASAMRRARLGVAAQTKPMGSFLFLGPTGVGKTETAKALAEAYFGSDQRMLRFDMSEYQGVTAIERMIGSSISQKPGVFSTQIRENPFSLLLLDEIEKADANVLNLFLQVLDEGFITDAFGAKVNCRNLIIIATSNAGAQLIREMVGQGIDLASAKQEIIDHILQDGVFRPEFLNRFDGVIIFHPLSEAQVLKISELLLFNLAKRLAGQGIIFKLNQPLIEEVAQLGFEPQSGARAMRRVIQSKVEDLIAKKMLKGEIKKNVPFEIKVEEIK